MDNNLYGILEISEDASVLEIYETVFKQIKQYCPDYKNNSDQARLMDLFYKAGYSAIKSKRREEEKVQEESRDKKEKLQDIKEVYICIYNENKIGFFKRKKWSGYNVQSFLGLASGSGFIYEGMDSKYIGINMYSPASDSGMMWFELDESIEDYSNSVRYKAYTANCNMNHAISYDDMRLQMYKDYKIDYYESGKKATKKEMADTLRYAIEYYHLDLIENTSKMSRRR